MIRRALQSLRTVIALGASLTAAPAFGEDSEGIESVTCPLSEQKEISFTGWDTRESIELRLLGSDCTKSLVVLAIRTGSGYPVFWDVWPLSNISVYRLDEKNQVEKTFGKLRKIKVTSSADIPSSGSECFLDEYCYFGEFVDSTKYEQVRASKLPLLCVPVHYENTQCYFFEKSTGVSKILYGFGA